MREAIDYKNFVRRRKGQWIIEMVLIDKMNDCTWALGKEKGDDEAVGSGVHHGSKQVAQFGGDAELAAQSPDAEPLGQQLHCYAYVVGIVHMTVIVDVGPHHADGFEGGTAIFGQDDAAVAIVHLEARLNGQRVDNSLVYAFEGSGFAVDKGAHTPRLIAGKSLYVVDESVAETELWHHLVDRSGDSQVLFEMWHTDNLHTTGGEQLRSVLLFKIALHRGFTNYLHFRTILHHLQGCKELQPASGVAGTGSDFII